MEECLTSCFTPYKPLSFSSTRNAPKSSLTKSASDSTIHSSSRPALSNLVTSAFPRTVSGLHTQSFAGSSASRSKSYTAPGLRIQQQKPTPPPPVPFRTPVVSKATQRLTLLPPPPSPVTTSYVPLHVVILMKHGCLLVKHGYPLWTSMSLDLFLLQHLVLATHYCHQVTGTFK